MKLFHNASYAQKNLYLCSEENIIAENVDKYFVQSKLFNFITFHNFYKFFILVVQIIG